MSIPREYQSTHLFLLVGTNPLPNYVAIQLLRRPDGQVYLFHTAEVNSVADRICTVAGLRVGKEVTKIAVDDTNARDIVTKVIRAAKGKVGVGLNYTGGTKHMAVHAYEAMAELARATPGFRFVASYLDARKLSLRVEEPGTTSRDWPVDVAVDIRIETLVRLHGDRVKEYRCVPIQPAIYPTLVHVPHRALVEWRQRELQGKGQEKLPQIYLPAGEPFMQLASFWPGCQNLGDLAQAWQVPIEELAQWLHGHWLEDYVLWSFQQTQPATQIHNCGLNLRLQGRDFEFDVFAIRGYQLFALSCTHDADKKSVKLKLFEAFVRARQMGGDEARVGLVCRTRDAEAIQRELEEEWDAEGRIRVFGEDALQTLPEALIKWLVTK